MTSLYKVLCIKMIATVSSVQSRRERSVGNSMPDPSTPRQVRSEPEANTASQDLISRAFFSSMNVVNLEVSTLNVKIYI